MQTEEIYSPSLCMAISSDVRWQYQPVVHYRLSAVRDLQNCTTKRNKWTACGEVTLTTVHMSAEMIDSVQEALLSALLFSGQRRRRRPSRPGRVQVSSAA